VYLAWALRRLLGLDCLLSKQMPSGREDVPWATVAVILCIARFCRPSSELFIEKRFHPRSALEDLLGVDRESRDQFTDQKFGRNPAKKPKIQFLFGVFGRAIGRGQVS
jgi:hypothetical protein